MSARLVRGRIGFAIHRLDQTLGKHVNFDLLAADIGQHVAVDFDAWAEHLAALLNHLLALQGIVDNVAIFERQIVFAHDGADALAPAAGRFQVGNNFRFVHKALVHPQNAITAGFCNAVLSSAPAAIREP